VASPIDDNLHKQLLEESAAAKNYVLRIRPVQASDSGVRALVNALDDFQISLYGLSACNLEPVEELERARSRIVGAYLDDTLIGIGAIKLFPDYAELKRVYVSETHRRSGASGALLDDLENHAAKNGLFRIFLETGYLHLAAIHFYRKRGFIEVESFGNYTSNPVSVYMQKTLSPQQAVKSSTSQ
jgi:putative acetyltransferase